MFLTIIGSLNLAISTTISLILLCFFGLVNPYSKVCEKIFYTWSWLALKLAGVKIEIHGLENIDPNKGYVLCSNHLHIFDIPVLCVATKLNLRFAAKKELFKIPVFGQAITLIGMIKIDRGNNKEALNELKKVEEVIEKHKVAVGIFAEGTRNKSGRGLLEFKKGAFMMAMNTKQELLPVTMNGTNKILRGFRVKPRTVSIHIHPPVDPTQYTPATRKKFMDSVEKTIYSVLEDK